MGGIVGGVSKTGMIASLTVIALTGSRILKPMLPLHPIAGMAFIGFALWYVYQKDHRVVHLRYPAHGKREPVDRLLSKSTDPEK